MCTDMLFIMYTAATISNISFFIRRTGKRRKYIWLQNLFFFPPFFRPQTFSSQTVKVSHCFDKWNKLTRDKLDIRYRKNDPIHLFPTYPNAYFYKGVINRYYKKLRVSILRNWTEEIKRTVCIWSIPNSTNLWHLRTRSVKHIFHCKILC